MAANRTNDLHLMKYLMLGIAFVLTLSNVEGIACAPPPRTFSVSRDYLQACEVGTECKPIIIRRKAGEAVELVLPEMLRTSVTVWDEKNYGKLLKRNGTYQPIQRTGTGNNATDLKETVLTLGKLKDGTYYVWLAGDSVGCTFQVKLKTE
ncbi:hypothetical protein [Hymenobacter elongatus]|uniref:Uncharacterized protein n=1 Tax=Hymenobacter elongatus TaxID=877208 RepID=A0A4Z0PG19_9BACT|nr:hypothetical protein [Hymenobacter elongatus]TGE13429.1 hypothetical protein E5J99_19380 [Hymenobacter elongatus]